MVLKFCRAEQPNRNCFPPVSLSRALPAFFTHLQEGEKDEYISKLPYLS